MFARRFEQGELEITQSGLDSVTPQLTIASASQALFNHPSEYEFDAVEQIDVLTEDEEISSKIDIARDFNLGGGQLQVKFGGKARWREKDYTYRMNIFDGYNGPDDLLLADVVCTVNMSDRTQLFLEMTNLTDEPYVAVLRLDDLGDRLLQ